MQWWAPQAPAGRRVLRRPPCIAEGRALSVGMVIAAVRWLAGGARLFAAAAAAARGAALHVRARNGDHTHPGLLLRS